MNYEGPGKISNEKSTTDEEKALKVLNGLIEEAKEEITRNPDSISSQKRLQGLEQDLQEIENGNEQVVHIYNIPE